MAESSPRKKIKCHQTIPENVPLPPTYLKVLPHVAPRTQDRPGYIKRGIPDVNRPPPANNIEHKVPCDNLKITDTLLKEFRISLQQGIPDAFKIHDLRRRQSPLSPNVIIRSPKKVAQSRRHDPHQPPPVDDPRKPRYQAPKTNEIQEDKPRKNSANNRLSFADRQPKSGGGRSNQDKNFHNTKKNKSQSDKSDERVKSFCMAPLSPQTMGVTGVSNYRSYPRQSKFGGMIKRIFWRCTRTMNSISNRSPIDGNLNFVCYRCNYPYFRLCRSTGCSQLATITGKSLFDGPGDVEDLQGMNMKRESVCRDDSARKHQQRVKKPAEAIDFNDSGDFSTTSATSAADSVRTDSVVDVLEEKPRDTGGIPFEGRLDNPLSSRRSSERLRKYIYDVFPPALDSLASRDDEREKAWSKEVFIEGGDDLPRGDEYLSQFLDHRRKLVGNFLESRRRLGLETRDVEVLYGRSSAGGMGGIMSGGSSRNDLIIESYSEGSKGSITSP